jgi:drug/metabolite transporter (DMT)-like permease
MKAREVAALFLLAAVWGGSFIFFRIAAPHLGPIPVAFLRVTIAGTALVGYARVKDRDVRWRGRRRSFLILGTLNGALPYTLIAAAELHLTASLAAILNATAPLFVVAVVAVRLGALPSPATIAGLILGIVGVAALVGWSGETAGTTLLLSVGASLAAALSYALAGVYAKTAFFGGPPLSLAIGQQIGAAIVLAPVAVPVAVIDRPDRVASVGDAAAILALALLCTSAAYLLYFYLIATVGPTKTLSVTFLSPVFGLLWSALFLGEQIQLTTIGGLAMILVGVSLVTGVEPRRVVRPALRFAAIVRGEPPVS